jgi:hypothetical protein
MENKEEEKKKVNWKILAFWTMIFAVVILCIFLVLYVKTQSYKCIVNPGSYFINTTSRPPEYSFCTCQVMLNNTYVNFVLDNAGVHLQKPIT